MSVDQSWFQEKKEKIILLDKAKIYHALCALAEHSGLDESDIIVFDKIGSTNDYLYNLCQLSGVKTKICLAESQTAGKGRLNRDWHSPFGQNLYFSCLYYFAEKSLQHQLDGLSLIVGLAVIKTLQRYQPQHPVWIKWPNDIIYQAKKLAGILIQLKNNPVSLACQAVIGIGLNVNMLFAPNISQPWISLKEILKKNIDRNQLCAYLIADLLAYLKKFEQAGLSVFLAEWQSSDYLLNKKIFLTVGEQRTHGTVQGINASGHLLLKVENNDTLAFSAGEASVK